MAEFDLIELVRARCASAREDVLLGIGDDAALLAVPTGQALAVSTDTLVEGIHFPKNTAPFDIGWKALAVNLSDLAAMGATPAWATLALTLPQADRDWVAGFADGFSALARTFKFALVGGDTTQGPLAITVTVLGLVPEELALRRDGAQAGDGVFVTGTLGDAAAGLRLLRNGGREAPGSETLAATMRAALIGRLERPTPRVAQGLLLRGRGHACIDVSDGLAADLGHICKASSVGAEIDMALLPASPALLGIVADDARAPLQLGGGDDYELCFTAPAQRAGDILDDLARSGCGATRIGRIVAGAGVRVRGLDGNFVEGMSSRLATFFLMKLDPNQRALLLRDPAGWIACGFGSGLSPVAPGTAGSLAALLPWLALRELPWPLYLVAMVLAFAIGTWACGHVIRRLRIDDPGFVVCDEFVGQWIALTPLLGGAFVWWQLAAGFVLFRLFDILKPWPVSWADRSVEGGLGVMLDDVLAGIYAMFALTALTTVVR